ncbi:MAG: hypothetical protein Q8Q85_15780 [Gemmatimonadales bacterium]|nr:hypothetical protein [Gemmatimonadales bacterium]
MRFTLALAIAVPVAIAVPGSRPDAGATAPPGDIALAGGQQGWSCPATGSLARLSSLPPAVGRPLPAVADSALFERNGIERLYWRGDLNGDRRTDFIADYGSTGSQGADFAVFVGCGGGRYLRALHVFATTLTVLQSAALGFRDLRGDFELTGTDVLDLEFYRWTGSGYARQCAAAAPVDSLAALTGCPCCR